MTYSNDFRRKVLSIRNEEQLSMAKVAKRFGVSLASVLRWTQNLESKKKRNKPATKIDREALRRDVEERPDAYIYERAKRLGVSKSGVGYALKRLGVTYKKNVQSSQSRSRKTLCILPKHQNT